MLAGTPGSTKRWTGPSSTTWTGCSANSRQLEDLIDLCETRNGAFQLHNVNGEMDLVTSSGRFVARMLVAKAAMESDDLSRRLRRSFDQKAAEGRPHGARAFGYEPDGMTIRESEAALFRQAAADILAGASLNEIAKRWNDLGVCTSQSGRQWNGTVVKATLTGPPDTRGCASTVARSSARPRGRP